MLADTAAVPDPSAMSRDELLMQSQVQQAQAQAPPEPAWPTMLDSNRLSQIRRRRSSTNGCAALHLHYAHLAMCSQV